MSFQSRLASAASRMILPVMERLRQRSIWWKLGLFPVRSVVQVQQVCIRGRVIRLQVPPGETDRQQQEIQHLYGDDPYQLRTIRGPVKTVVDIGGNIGFFALLARLYFPAAEIHSYEPNPSLQSAIKSNTEGMNIQVFGEGVGAREMTGVMQCDGDTLEGALVPASPDSGGGIPIVTLATVLQRCGDSVDLLKMDCEGAEWGILSDSAGLDKVRRITMEYHLDGGPERTLLNLLILLKKAGFYIESLREAANPLVGQLFASRRA